MIRIAKPGPLLLAAAFAAFSGIGWHQRAADSALPTQLSDRVVIPPPIQVLLAGGDRFLAANIEAIRALTLTSDSPEAAADNISFGIRSRNAVAHLNPCHEDNYYLANALLTWGGAASQGSEVLRLATACRFWDEIPPFFYGFNLYYFDRDTPQAHRILNQAADRAKENAPALRKLAIMLTAESFKDDAAALSYLENERDNARDARLRETLTKRVVRLQGLITLREAQASYERKYGTPLTAPEILIAQGFLSSFPVDPLNIGYEFDGHRFRMREIRISGLEPPKR